MNWTALGTSYITSHHQVRNIVGPTLQMPTDQEFSDVWTPNASSPGHRCSDSSKINKRMCYTVPATHSEQGRAQTPPPSSSSEDTGPLSSPPPRFISPNRCSITTLHHLPPTAPYNLLSKIMYHICYAFFQIKKIDLESSHRKKKNLELCGDGC